MVVIKHKLPEKTEGGDTQAEKELHESIFTSNF